MPISDPLMGACVAVKLPLLIALIHPSNGLLGTGFGFWHSLLASLTSFALAALDMGGRTREGVSIRAPLARGDFLDGALTRLMGVSIRRGPEAFEDSSSPRGELKGLKTRAWDFFTQRLMCAHRRV